MIEFLKQRKVVIIIGILVTILVGWKLFDSKNFEEINSNEILVSNLKNNEKEKNEDKEEEMMAIHVTGEVKNPGVVKVKQGSRIEDIIEAAGGLTENADITNVNLAFEVEDGMKIRIPSNDEGNENEGNIIEHYITQDSGKGVIVSEDKSSENLSLVININTANETELEQLPGIGASIAGRIIDYRNKNGKFKAIEDIKNVTGIGETKFEKIKDFIKVK
ncbi:MAG: helix-hairpin-helix domain-containing protein [Clostridia bacterium]|nr:helix-hairpin-helix domain-containing protein [Clostridia bacterium]